MPASPVAFATKDNASGQLQSGINASVLSIPLKAGNGANFPQPYTGSASSLGSSQTLNSTGVSAAVGGSAVLGKFIWNKTDGSIAIITAVATDALTTTRLLGGTDNTWQSADVWAIDPIVATFARLDADNEIDTYEEALVTARSTDTLSVPTGGRGYNGTVANTFSADDYVYLFVTSPIVEKLKDVLSVLLAQQDTDRTTLATALTNIANLQTGSYHYVAAGGSSSAYTAATPALAAYAASNIVRFKANHTNSGAATLNVNGLGAQAIKKNDGATALSAGDIVSGQIVTVVYDGTNFQMLSPIGTPATNQGYAKVVYMGFADSSSIGTSTNAIVNYDTHTYAIAANDLINGVGYEFEGGGTLTHGAGNSEFFARLGSTDVCVSSALTPAGTGKFTFRGVFWGTAAAGGSVAIHGRLMYGIGNVFAASNTVTANVATNGGLTLQFAHRFATSNGSNAIVLTDVVIKKISTSLFS